ncbi:MAG: polysaccharide biosynthesis tyrosine autokinase [Bacteroidota bacterium]|nr:polysaccharide biosynthesis tyrosine autokinase [Flavisolibacter sp.]MDQ3843430.1 polysaccharide biosynthesis tyrosine autokinase [Bacteroidota bacterium]
MQVSKKQDSGNPFQAISRYWFKYFPFWPLFLLICGLCLVGAWYYIQHRIPLYSASASILIKDDRKGTDDPKVIEDLNPVNIKRSLENEIEVLRSRSLMSKVVTNLGLYAPVYEEGKFVPQLAYNSSPISIIVKDPYAMRPHENIHFSFNPNTLRVSLDNASYPLDNWVNTNYGTLKFVKNNNYYQPANKPLFFNLVPPMAVAGGILVNLSIRPVNRMSNIVKLSVTDEAAQRASDILNELLNVYNESGIEEKNRLAANTLAFVEQRLNLVTRELDSIEKRIQKFKSSKSTYNVSAQGDQFLQNIGNNDQKIADVSMQLAVLDQVEGYVRSKNTQGGIVPSTLGVNDGVLSSLLGKLYDTELEYERLKKTTAENHPTLLAISDQINKIKPSIIENIQNQRKSLLAKKSNIQATTGMYASMLQRVPEKEKELIEISRDQAIKNGIYTFLLQKREETALSYASKPPESKIIDKAIISGVPITSDTNIYLISIGIALLLFIGFVTTRELLTQTVLYRHEIEDYTSLPIIGEIAYKKADNPLITDDGGKSYMAEQFRKLRTSLTFLGIDSKRKRILVTSTISGEGKSFITANLGISLAMADKKVIVLEFDLKNPSLGNKLGFKTDRGLSDYLKGTCEPEEVIKRTPVHENLFIISSGPLPENPTELIMSERVKELFAYLDGVFDCILIDTAPVGPATDGYVLSSYCDATLYVIRHKYTPKVFVQRIDEENKINQLKNPAIVFNAVLPRGFSKNSFGYGYGYGYEYIYGEKYAGKYVGSEGKTRKIFAGRKAKTGN